MTDNLDDLGIVKVQWPIAGENEVLIYNEDRSIMLQIPCPDEIKQYAIWRKAYFYYSIENKIINLLTKLKCPRQDW